jgi:hypothetical protein
MHKYTAFFGKNDSAEIILILDRSALIAHGLMFAKINFLIYIIKLVKKYPSFLSIYLISFFFLKKKVFSLNTLFIEDLIT